MLTPLYRLMLTLALLAAVSFLGYEHILDASTVAGVISAVVAFVIGADTAHRATKNDGAGGP